MFHSKQDTQNLLARAAAFRFLAQGFAYPQPGHAEGLWKAASELEEIQPLRAGMAMQQAGRAFRHCRDEELQSEYFRLFLGNSAMSLHETAYGDGRRIAGKTSELADIGGFYAAFGLHLSDSDPDLPDHLCSELEFYSLLLVKQAYAERSGWTSRGRITKAAARAFLAQHLGRWTDAVAANLRQNNASRPYLLLGEAVSLLVRAEVRRLSVRPSRILERLPFDEMQSEEFICPQAA